MRGRLIWLVALAAAAIFITAAGASPRPTSYTLPGDRVFPEGVAYERETGFFYVTSTEDGTVFRGRLDRPAASVFIPGTTGQFSAIGIKADRFRLYVAGGRTGTVRVAR